MIPIILRFDRSMVPAWLPEGWHELPFGTWPALVDTWGVHGEYSRESLGLLMRDRLGRKLPDRLLSKIPTEALGSFFQAMNWLERPCTHPPIAYVILRGHKYYLPAPEMAYSSIVEFAFVDMAWQLIHFFEGQQNEEQTREWKARLAAYVCRPLDRHTDPTDATAFEGDRRERFNTALIEPRVSLFREHLRMADERAVYLYVAGVKRHLADQYPTIWPSDDKRDIAELTQMAKRSKPEPRRWIDLISKLAGGKFGTLDQTYHTNLYTFLDEITEQIRAAKKREAAAIHRGPKNIR